MEEENRVVAEHFWVYIGVEAKLLGKWGVLFKYCSNVVENWGPMLEYTPVLTGHPQVATPYYRPT
jgi:hypothetical protein